MFSLHNIQLFARYKQTGYREISTHSPPPPPPLDLFSKLASQTFTLPRTDSLVRSEAVPARGRIRNYESMCIRKYGFPVPEISPKKQNILT